MKILFLTDTHIRGTTPRNRKDNIVETLERKISEIINISNEYNVDYILHGGDLFDRPDISISIANKFASIFNKVNIPVYIISGNHDIYGHNPETVDRTMIGLFDTIGLVNLIRENDIVYLKKDNVTVQLTGQPYRYNMENEKGKYIITKKYNEVDYAIHMVHGMLLERPFIEGIPYTLIDEIKTTKADITLSGHYHTGFGIKKINNKYFVNPGSILRITNSKNEIERIPQIALINLDKDINIELIPLKAALPGEKVLDRKEVEAFVFKNEKLSQFKQTIEETSRFDRINLNNIILQISNNEGLPKEVKLEALKRIEYSQMYYKGEDLE